jgi:phosphoribosylformylglycinamidine (FGAM) synthase PurS component
MKGTHLIEVAYKPGVTDPLGNGLKREIDHLGLAKVGDVRTGQLYRIVGDLAREERDRIARDLLCDPVVQDFHDGSLSLIGGGKKKSASRMVVDVWYKSGVTDVIGESVLKGIKDLNVAAVSTVRTGARYRFDGLKKKEAAEKLTLALLANPLVHDYAIHAEE